MTASKEAETDNGTLETPCGLRIHRSLHVEPYEDAVLPLQSALDGSRGVLLTSSFEYPGRYTRWDIGFADPPLAFTGRGRRFSFDPLNARGALLLPPIGRALEGLDALESLDVSAAGIAGGTGTARWPPGPATATQRPRRRRRAPRRTGPRLRPPWSASSGRRGSRSSTRG